MAYLTIGDFKAGLDVRRMAAASEAGSLQVLKNAHINRGGEIEKAKAWVSTYTLPAGTLGFSSVNNELYVFGSDVDPGVPVGVNYQRLQNIELSALTSVDAVDPFSGALYVAATFADGLQYHFYDGDIIDDWYEGRVRAGHGTLAVFTSELADIISADPTGEVSASNVGTLITSVANVTNDAYTITATEANGGATDDQAIAVVNTVAAGVGVSQEDTVSLTGTFEAGDEFTVIVNGRYYGATTITGEIVSHLKTHKNKVYATGGVNVFFSGVAEPTEWKPQATGAGVIDLSAQASNEEGINAIGVYQNNLAFFGRTSTQVWSMDPDPDLNAQMQVMENIGTRSPKTVKSFGDSDVFFLSDFGYRSLRARDSSNTAGITDVGTPIDDAIITAMAAMTDAEIEATASAIEPNSGRYISSLDDKIYVFSFFPSSKISAWSTWEPGFGFSDFVGISGRLYGRADDVIYLLGGAANNEYTEEEVIVELPYLDARTIATWKRWTGLDVILEGTWAVYVNTNPLQPDEWVRTATVYQTSVGQMKLAMQQNSPVLKLKFVHQDTGAAKISKIILHYETKWAS